MKTADIPVSEQWASVRHRINQIRSVMESIAHDLTEREEEATDEVIQRLEALQEKFERVMGQLSAFDDESDDCVRKAKEEFGRIVERYRISKQNGRLRLH